MAGVGKKLNQSVANALKFYKNQSVANAIIKSEIRRRQWTVHGARSTNAALPDFLDKPTRDWDVFVKNPKKAAAILEKSLDKRFGGDFYGVKKGESVKVPVRKVFSKITQESVVDFAKSSRAVPTTNVEGIKMATLGYTKEHIKRTLKDPGAMFRAQKDRETLQRIKLFETMRGKKFAK